MSKNIKIFLILVVALHNNIHALSSRAAVAAVAVVAGTSAYTTHKARAVENHADESEVTYKIFARARAAAIGFVGVLATLTTACAVFKRTPKEQLKQAQQHLAAARAHHMLATKHATPQQFFTAAQRNAAVRNVADIATLEQQLEKGIIHLQQAKKDFSQRDQADIAQCDQSLQDVYNDLRYLGNQKRAIEIWHGLERK